MNAEQSQPEGERPAGRASANGSSPRRRILDALIETAAREGYRRTCMERVTSAAGVTEAVFQEYFVDIDDCFLQAGEEMIGRLELAVLRSVYSDAAWPERVRRGLYTLLGTIAEHPDHARVAMIELPQSGERAAERLRETEAVFASVFEEGRAYAESVSHLSEMSSVGVVGGIVGIIHRRVIEGHTSELPELLADLLHFALLPYVGQNRAMVAADAAR